MDNEVYRSSPASSLEPIFPKSLDWYRLIKVLRVTTQSILVQLRKNNRSIAMFSLIKVLLSLLYFWILPVLNSIFLIWVCGFYNILEIVYYYFIIINHYTGIFTYLYLFYLFISRYINFFVLKLFIIHFRKLCLFMLPMLYILKNGNIDILDSLYIELSNRGVELIDYLRNAEVIEGQNQSDLIEDVQDIRGLVIDGSSDLSGDDSAKRRGWKPDLAERLIFISWGIILIGYFCSK